MVAMFVWSNRLDADFSGSYACCTQQADANFHERFWMRFFLGATVAIVGCLALSASLPGKAAAKTGLAGLVMGIAMMLLSLAGTNLHGWVGASAITLAAVVFCGGAILLIVGGFRLGWTTWRSR
jgi:hypothetical protein